MSRNEKIAFALVGAGVVGAVVFAVLSLLSCSPAVEKRMEYTVTEGTHAKASADCLTAAKADSGTLAEFCVCWNRVNAEFHVDAGVECKR